MAERESGIWRDEEKLPLADLERAMGAAANDGQVDDVTGNDAGAEQVFGHGPESDPGVDDPELKQRAARPSTTGRTGPH